MLCVYSLSYSACNAHAPHHRLWPVGQYHNFPYYLTNGTILGKESLNIKMCVSFSVRLLSETFHILRRVQRDIAIDIHRSCCKVPFVLVRFEWNLNFVDKFSKNTQMSNFMKIRSVWAELSMWTDGQTDRQTYVTKLIIPFRNFANAPVKIV